MKRLFLFMVFMAVSIQANAAKMSSYTDNTTPNADVYFIGVDPNDLSQTVNGSNYRYSLNSVLGLGLLDAVFKSLSVNGTGDSWLELNNNASFSGSLVGKYGYSFLTTNPTAIINGTTERLALYSELGSFAFDTYPTYEDSAHSSGIAVNGTTLAVYSETAAKWLTVDLTDTLNPTPTTPTLTSLTIPTNGATATAVFSEAMTVGAGGNGGWTLNTPTNAMTYASGSGTDTIVFNLASTIMDADTPTVSYTQPGNGWESNDDNVDLVTISGSAVTNNSTQIAATNRFEWAAEDLTAEVFDATDGDTIVVASEGTPSHSFVTGQTNNAIQLASGSWCYIPATNTNNIVLAGDTIRFHFRRVSGTSSSAHRVISVGNTDLELDFRRSSAGETRYGMSVAGASYFRDTTENIYDGNWHYIILTWNSSAQTYSFQIDSSTYSGSLTTTDVPTPGTNRIYFGGYSAATSALVVNYDNVEVE